ncbi:MAG: NUDIX domain-containing protein [Arachnia propionica]|uniref:NUDIX domain-containing protein n=1 Tax=Arachnia propionica TaxID=1750 RepID=UPI00270DE9E6|nr:NUDIX domain-containing protein [Arachnia propionica]
MEDDGQVEVSRQTDTAVTGASDRRVVQKVVAYVVHQDRLLVFTHDDVAIEVTGVQVPAGTIHPGEPPEDAALRETREETGLETRMVRALGVEHYDFWPMKPEVHERHFFLLSPLEEELPEQWTSGEESPADGGSPQRWTCWWQPLQNAHVLCAGLSARIAQIGNHPTT